MMWSGGLVCNLVMIVSELFWMGVFISVKLSEWWMSVMRPPPLSVMRSLRIVV